MSLAAFLDQGRAGYNLVPIVRTSLADMETPLSVYLKCAAKPYTYLLESVQGGERFGRYSFIGLPSRIRLRVVRHQVFVERDEQPDEVYETSNPLEFIEQYQQKWKVAPCPTLTGFCGGLAGYFSHDIVRYIEPKLDVNWFQNPIQTPDALLLLTTELVVFDGLLGQLHLVVYADPNEPDAYHQAEKRLDSLMDRLKDKLPETPTEPFGLGELEYLTPQNVFYEQVERAKAFIRAGDVMQVVLSQCIHQRYEGSPLSLYRALRHMNPSPYMFYYDLGDFKLVGASPEILVRLEQDTVVVRPLAGTRARGKTEQEDQSLEAELKADPKEIAEHVMLIDLGRNDVGRIAQSGSVKVSDIMVVERYSHVMHLVSQVVGKLKPGLNAWDVLKATFPAGTLSGAPKVRALEIIDELELHGRAVYGGAVGYLGFDGRMDLAIAIRTGVIHQGRLWVQAGAGIVADSVPEMEWHETENKAMAVLKAAEWASQGFFAKDPE